MNFIKSVVGNNNDPLLGVLEGKPADSAVGESVEVVPQDMDFMCDGYLVTPEGKLMKKARAKRKVAKKVDEGGSFPRQNTGGTLPTMASTTFRSEVEYEGEGEEEEVVVEQAIPRGSAAAAAAPAMTSRPTPTPPPPVVRNVPPPALIPIRGSSNFKNALIIMPPRELWDPIQQIRSVWDPAFVRWMPHINVVWPFAVPSMHDKAAHALVNNGFSTIKPFDICFKDFGVFHNKQSVLFLNPVETQNGGRMQAIREVCNKTFGEKPAQPFRPHLTVGKMGKHKIKEVSDSINWTKMTFTVKELYIISRPDDVTPFSVIRTVPLGGQ